MLAAGFGAVAHSKSKICLANWAVVAHGANLNNGEAEEIYNLLKRQSAPFDWELSLYWRHWMLANVWRVFWPPY